MPKRLVTGLFYAIYKGQIHPDSIGENVVFNLSLGMPIENGKRLTIDRLVFGSSPETARLDRARIFAMAKRDGFSLCDLFLVSREAMALRLMQLNLVM